MTGREKASDEAAGSRRSSERRRRLDLDELKALWGNKMLKLRIESDCCKGFEKYPDYIVEDNEEYAAKTIKEIYGKFENLQMFRNGVGFIQTGQLDRL